MEEEHAQVLFVGYSLWGKIVCFYIPHLVPAVSYKCENMQGLIRVRVVGSGGWH